MPEAPPRLATTRQTFLKRIRVDCGTRAEQRRKVALRFLREREWAKYVYEAEECSDRRVLLKRPANLNWGFDFTVVVDPWVNGKPRRPSHKDVLNDLRGKKRESKPKFYRLRTAIRAIYCCERLDSTLENCKGLSFQTGLPVDALLATVKWLFIEQDITYWSFSGRRRLMAAISEI